MRQRRDEVLASAQFRRIAGWGLAMGIAWAAALVWPGLDLLAAVLLLGVAMVSGVNSDLNLPQHPGVAAFLSNTAALLAGAGIVLLARQFLA